VCGEQDTLDYIAHRLQAAGAERRVFSDEALDAVCRGSRGVPRLINTICDTALLYGYAEELPVIDEAVIAQVIADRGLASGDPVMLPMDSAQRPEKAPQDEAVQQRMPDDEPDIARQIFGMPGGKK